jgi:hypothetical protein
MVQGPHAPFSDHHDHRLTLMALILWAALTAEAKQLALTRGRLARVLENFGRASLVAYVFHEAALYWGQIPWNLFALFGHRAPWPTWTAVTLSLIVVTYGVGRLSERLPAFRFTPTRWWRAVWTRYPAPLD